jgi:hypothetical protein
MAPRELAFPLQSLPPILHIPHRIPISGYSKGSRGLSVQPQVIGIFTDIPISPSPLLRQCPDRYTIRAGRNLPDKEFRYLRTVRSCYNPTKCRTVRSFPSDSLCRHRDRTISSLVRESGVWSLRILKCFQNICIGVSTFAAIIHFYTDFQDFHNSLYT